MTGWSNCWLCRIRCATAAGEWPASPAGFFWVHRAREPNLVHGVFSLAAAAATRAGLPVHLLLDDLR